MAKLKLTKRTIEDVDTDYELPVYLYFQDEDGQDELIKITEKENISIKQNFFGYDIKVSNLKYLIDDIEVLKKAITTKQHFDSALEYALTDLTSYKI